jgi:hypothetical protein
MRDVDAQMVAHLMEQDGHIKASLNVSERVIKTAIQKILREPDRHGDYAGEQDDMYEGVLNGKECGGGCLQSARTAFSISAPSVP